MPRWSRWYSSLVRWIWLLPLLLGALQLRVMGGGPDPLAADTFGGLAGPFIVFLGVWYGLDGPARVGRGPRRPWQQDVPFLVALLAVFASLRLLEPVEFSRLRGPWPRLGRTVLGGALPAWASARLAIRRRHWAPILLGPLLPVLGLGYALALASPELVLANAIAVGGALYSLGLILITDRPRWTWAPVGSWALAVLGMSLSMTQLSASPATPIVVGLIDLQPETEEVALHVWDPVTDHSGVVIVSPEGRVRRPPRAATLAFVPGHRVWLQAHPLQPYASRRLPARVCYGEGEFDHCFPGDHPLGIVVPHPRQQLALGYGKQALVVVDLRSDTAALHRLDTPAGELVWPCFEEEGAVQFRLRPPAGPLQRWRWTGEAGLEPLSADPARCVEGGRAAPAWAFARTGRERPDIVTDRGASEVLEIPGEVLINAFSEDGTTMGLLMREPRRVRVFPPVPDIPADEASDIVLSRDGRLVASVLPEGQFRIQRTADGVEVMAGESDVRKLAWSGQRLFLVRAGRLFFIDFEEGVEAVTFPPPFEELHASTRP